MTSVNLSYVKNIQLQRYLFHDHNDECDDEANYYFCPFFLIVPRIILNTNINNKTNFFSYFISLNTYKLL